MKFINNGKSIKVRIGFENCYWKTVYTGDIIDLQEHYGKALGLTELKTTEGRIGNKVVETKQIHSEKKNEYTSDDLFFNELKSIKGIGRKTAEDIVSWGTKEKLIEYISKNKKIPFRDDVEKKLEVKYGRINN